MGLFALLDRSRYAMDFLVSHVRSRRVYPLERVLEVLLRLLRHSLVSLQKPTARVARRRGQPVRSEGVDGASTLLRTSPLPFGTSICPCEIARNFACEIARAKSRVRNRAKFRVRNRACEIARNFRVAQTGHFIEFRANRTLYRFT